ncbi:MAG: FAD-binding oxidoreductase [Phyllobacterium sp.]
MIDKVHLDQLAQILDGKGFLTEAGDLAAYQAGARYDEGQAAFVARPATTEETSAVLACCARAGIPLIPQSGNTGVVSGSTPDSSGTQGVLSLDRLNQLFELDVANRSVRVGAGFRLSDLNRKLEAHGLFFAVDLSADPCIGGMLSTNTGGSRFLRYGDVRRNVLGIKVALADGEGTVLDFTGGLRKNNTGVDWKQFFIGTSGAFGVITECVLNLEPIPRQTATALLVPRSGSHVIGLLREMESRLGSYLSAFEGMSRNAVAHAFSHVPSLSNPFESSGLPDYLILAEITRSWPLREGEMPLDTVMENVLGEIFELPDEPLADAFPGRPEEIWALRHALSEGVKHAGRLIAFDLAFRRGDIMRFSDYMRDELPKHFADVEICDFGHIGDGGVHFNLVVAPNDQRLNDPAFEASLRAWVMGVAVEEFQGSFSAEHAIGRKNQNFYDKYTAEKCKEMARALKAATSTANLGSVRFG